jgi:hypothetical protein
MTTIIECRPPVAEKSAEGHQEQAKTRQPDIKVITEQAMWNTAITRTYSVDYPFIGAGMAMIARRFGSSCVEPSCRRRCRAISWIASKD